jgi:hypothetical protein
MLLSGAAAGCCRSEPGFCDASRASLLLLSVSAACAGDSSAPDVSSGLRPILTSRALLLANCGDCCNEVCSKCLRFTKAEAWILLCCSL